MVGCGLKDSEEEELKDRGVELRGEGREWLSAWRAAEPEEARTGDAAAPVVGRTCAFGREVPERVRRPRKESGGQA